MTDKTYKDKRGAGRDFAPRDRGDRGSAPFKKREGGKSFGDKPFGGKPFGKGRPDRDFSKPKVEGVVRPADMEERIAKVIARAGIASRRDAEALIAEGRVTLDGEVLTSPAINVGPFARITIDGEPLPERERTRLWLYHKPRGLVTTARDPEGRSTVFENLPEDMPRVISIGRLDINTEGLLLLTNDGGLARVIAHPDTGWLRRYKVRAHGDVTQADLDKLANGITIDGIEYGPVEARLDRVQGDNAWLTLGLREGKNREVKRILEVIGLSVNRLIRLSFGPFQLGDLEAGLVEEIRTKVLKEQLGDALAAEANVDFVRPVREPVATHAPRRFDDDAAEDEADPHAARREQEMASALERRDRHRAVWRSDDIDSGPPRKSSAPRRGADPKQARDELAERPRQRVGAIETGSGRSVRVERFAPQTDAEERPRRSFGDRDRPSRDGGGRSFGEKRPYDRTSGEDRPRRPYGDRPSRDGDRSFGEKRPYDRSGGEDRPRKPYGDRPARDGDRSFGEKRPYDRSGGDDRPRKPYGDRPARDGDRSFGEKRPFNRSGGDDRPRKPYGDRPTRDGDRSFGEKRPYDRSGGDDDRPRKPYGDRPARDGDRSFGEKRPFNRSGGDDRPRQPYGDRPSRDGGGSFGEKRPFNRSGGEDRPRKPYGDRPSRDGERSFGEKRPFERSGGDDRPRKPYGDRPAGKSFGGNRPGGGKGFGGGKSFGGNPARGGPPRGGKPGGRGR